jgi:hypothetical protein
MTTNDFEKRVNKAIEDGEVHYCKNCNKAQPVELTFFNRDEDTEPTLLVCFICKESIGFIENL